MAPDMPQDEEAQPSPESLKHKILVKCQKPYGKAKKKGQKIVVSYDDEGRRDVGEVGTWCGASGAHVT